MLRDLTDLLCLSKSSPSVSESVSSLSNSFNAAIRDLTCFCRLLSERRDLALAPSVSDISEVASRSTLDSSVSLSMLSSLVVTDASDFAICFTDSASMAMSLSLS